jgi:rSAM/selenodomain-associated transferase 2
VSAVSIVVPVLNEEKALPALIAAIVALDPPPDEVLLVDGGSDDATCDIARKAGWRVLASERGRAVQINAGVAAAQGPLVCVLHADTILPPDAVAVIRATLADGRVALAGFTPLICGPEKTRWGTSFHNWIKTWYAPLIMRPHLFLRGVRLLFGDHAMFFRRADFLAAGGCDPGTPVMEEADLCIRMARLGKVRLVPRIVRTSDRRVAEWGPLRANWIYFKVGMMWAFGARKRLAHHYPDVR